MILPALRVMLDQHDYVLFPYRERFPVDLIPNIAEAQPALVISKDDAGTIWKLPTNSLEQNTEDRVNSVTIDSSGTVFMKETRILRGLDAYNMRTTIRECSQGDLKDSLRESAAGEGLSAPIDSFTITGKDEFDGPLELVLYYTLDNSLSFAGSDVILQTGGLTAPVIEMLCMPIPLSAGILSLSDRTDACD